MSNTPYTEKEQEILYKIDELKKELAILRKREFLDFAKLRDISQYGFESVEKDLRKIALSIHKIDDYRYNIHSQRIIEVKNYGRPKVGDHTQEQIKESNELLQEILDIYCKKVKEKLKL